MKKIFYSLLTVLILTNFFSIRILSQSYNFSELEKSVLAELKEKNGVGAAIAIIKGDKVVYSKGFGSANIETNAPVTPQTLFQVGSVTKAFTAEMILSMTEEGKLNLEDPIGNYAKNLSPKLSKMTLARLLSHTSGIIDEPDEFGSGDASLMASYINSWKDDYALFENEKIFSYSNAGFALAGFTAQEQSGKLYIDLMNEKVFQPLGMTNTTFLPTMAMTYPLAVGHLKKPNERPTVVRPLAQDARLYPAGTIYTNLHDLSRFAIAFLNDGMLDGRQIISQSVIRKMSTPHARQLSASDDTSYGYGMFMNTSRGLRQLWHEGSMTGYAALMKFVPQQKLAIIILSNTDNVSLTESEEKALELMIKLAPDKKSSNMPIQMSETEMGNYVGTYSQPRRWNSEVFTKNGKLYIKEFEQEMQLNKIGENRFSFQFPNAKQPIEIFIQPAGNGGNGFLHQYVWAFKKI